MPGLRKMRRMSRKERVLAWVWCRLVSLGLVPARFSGDPPIGPLALETIGRRSGLRRSFAVTWIELDGDRYLVSMLGEESAWVHNVRAAGGLATVRRGRRRQVRLEELPVEERSRVLQAWLRRTGVSSVPPKYLGVDRDAPIEAFETLAPRWPVFRMRHLSA